MDGLPLYQRPAPIGWLRLLFLTTGFVIGGMCLWAFVQKESAKRSSSPAEAAYAQAAADQADSTRVLQLADDPQLQSWQTESPAHLAIQSAKPASAELAESMESPAWSMQRDLDARQASFEKVDSQAIQVSKPPLGEAEQFIPLPEFAPLGPEDDNFRGPVDGAGLEPNMPYTSAPVAGEAESPAPQAAASGPRPDSIIAVANDSFWNIAQRVYGDPRYYTALYEHNRNWIAYPDQIEAGFRVMTPPVEHLREHYPELCPDLR